MFKCVKTKTGEKHKVFGVHFLKRHNFRDKRWQPEHKKAQYDVLTQLHEKDGELKQLTISAKRTRLETRLKTLQHEVITSRKTLKTTLYGDVQRLKNILQKHKDLQRMYKNMPQYKIVDSMNETTFQKRKLLDLLQSHKIKLSSEYAARLLYLAQIQNRIKYEGMDEQKDKQLGNTLRVELKNSETRVKAIKLINKSFKTILDGLQKDAIYFEPTLSELEEDLKEQQEFIERTIRMGLPALKNLEKMNNEYEMLERKTRRDLEVHTADVVAFREEIKDHEKLPFALVRHDSDFEVFPKRYNRETESMMELKNVVENLESAMMAVKKATSCDPDMVFDCLKRQRYANDKLDDQIIRRIKENFSLTKRGVHATVIKTFALNDLSPEDLLANEEVNQIRDQTLKVKEDQKLDEAEMQRYSDILCILRYAFQHFFTVLSRVGENHKPDVRKYPPNSDLELPLLNFMDQAVIIRPPSPCEEDIDSLIKIVRNRVKILMGKYLDSQPAANAANVEETTEESEAIKVYHTDVMKSLEDVLLGEDMGEAPRAAIVIAEDVSVPSRKVIKMQSAKLVEINLRKEDD